MLKLLSFTHKTQAKKEYEREEKGLKMSGTTGGAPEEDKKPSDQSAHINLKVKGQVRSTCSSCFRLNLDSFDILCLLQVWLGWH